MKLEVYFRAKLREYMRFIGNKQMIYMKISGNSKDLTPTKPAKRGPKPKEEGANDICRLCFTNLKQKFGDFEKSLRISTANVDASRMPE